MQLPFFSELKDSQRILIAGAGGGFDIFSGLPLYFFLQNSGKDVFLANLSFTNLDYTTAQKIHPVCWKIDQYSQGRLYFPEAHLCKWLAQHHNEQPIYAIDSNIGTLQAKSAYLYLIEELSIDTVILVDGGTDSLMRGDEAGLGTPVEDITSISAVHGLDIENSYLVCLGFGVDSYHGICHAHYLEAVADIAQKGGYLGAFSLLSTMPEVQQYIAATEYVNQQNAEPSIVCYSVLSSLEGQYGDHHKTSRTEGSQLWINPLLAMYWFFRLKTVAKRCMYLQDIKNTTSYKQTRDKIYEFRNRITPKSWQDIPV